jgi:hypothetical protein
MKGKHFKKDNFDKGFDILHIDFPISNKAWDKSVNMNRFIQNKCNFKRK